MRPAERYTRNTAKFHRTTESQPQKHLINQIDDAELQSLRELSLRKSTHQKSRIIHTVHQKTQCTARCALLRTQAPCGPRIVGPGAHCIPLAFSCRGAPFPSVQMILRVIRHDVCCRKTRFAQTSIHQLCSVVFVPENSGSGWTVVRGFRAGVPRSDVRHDKRLELSSYGCCTDAVDLKSDCASPV